MLKNTRNGGRADKIWNQRADLVSELVKELKRENIESIIYSNANIANKYLSSVNTDFWLAYYPDIDGKIPSYWYPDLDQEASQNEILMNKLVAWQFTESGVGNVIPEIIDLSIVRKNFYK